MTDLELQGVWAPPRSSLSAVFRRGLNVVLGSEQDGTAELIALSAGTREPRRGWLRLGGGAPARSPRLRRRIASLLATESMPAAGSVKDWLEEVSHLAGFDAAAKARQYYPDLSPDRSLSSLGAVDRRRLALALALSHPDPLLVALHDPFAGLEGPALELVSTRLRELARGAVVLVTTASALDARRLGGSLHVLEHGALARRPIHAWPDALTPGLPVELTIECRAPRELLQHLLADPVVSGATFTGGRARVTGTDLAGLSRAVMRAAIEARADVRALQVTSPDLRAVHAASSEMALAVYRAAQHRPTSGEIGDRGQHLPAGERPAPGGEDPGSASPEEPPSR